jgi:hypothetical protein
MNYDTYKKDLIEAIAEHTKENGDPFEFAADGDYSFMFAMDMLVLDLDDRGNLLGFAITNTTEGEGNPTFLNVSYWSKAIGKQISFGECVPNLHTSTEFAEWAAAIKREIVELESKLPVILPA